MGKRRKRVSRKGCKCSFYINTNISIYAFVGDKVVLGFLRRHGHESCISNIVLKEFRASGVASSIKRVLTYYNVCVVSVKPSLFVKRGMRVCMNFHWSFRSIIDVVHILIAKSLNAVLVTADKKMAFRARKLKVSVLLYDVSKGEWAWM